MSTYCLLAVEALITGNHMYMNRNAIHYIYIYASYVAKWEIASDKSQSLFVTTE